MGLQITVGCDTAWIWTRVSVVMPLALRCSALDRRATKEPSGAKEKPTTLHWSWMNKYQNDKMWEGERGEVLRLDIKTIYWTTALQ